MNEATRARLFGVTHAFDNGVTLWVTVVIATLLIATPIIILALSGLGIVKPDHRRELLLRYYSWLVLTPMMLLPILAGAFWTILGLGILSLFCYREFARAVGLFREKTISLVVALGIIVITLTALDHWYGLFVAITPFTITLIASAAILRDEPKGYIERVGLGVLGFTLFGTCFGHLSYFANDANYRPYLILIFMSVELNDVFAYISGKSVGRRKLAPKTSPNKTLGGALGALLLTTLLVCAVGHYLFRGTALAHPSHLIALGVLMSLAGQLGDLTVSSVKRDLGVKDMGVTIPGHGGLLDRFDSIILVAPVMFHYINYFIGIGTDQTPHVFTGLL